MMTALQFVTQFRDVHVRCVGREDDLFWASVDVDEDGTELQSYFIMERGNELRVIHGLSAVEEIEASTKPLKFWDHERAEQG
jgi:hypothetical protein